MGKKKRSGWNELLKLVATDDGLPTRESGSWAGEKLFFWNRYIEITTNAMVGHRSWQSGMVYVDLFSGPGVCRDKKSGERFPGSPLIAANAPKSFERILLCDIDRDTCDACEERLATSPAAGRYRIFHGDCNVQIDRIVSAIPRGALTLAFLDPTGLHLRFTTVKKLSAHGRVDLLILFPDAVDIQRNADHYYFEQTDSKLDQVLGEGSDWRKRKAEVAHTDAARKRRVFAEIYKDQLRRLAGYEFFDDEVINGPSGPLYRLVYATKHKRGLDFWTKSIKKERSGQRRMF